MPRDAKQPFLGRHLCNLTLTGSGSDKDTRHHDIALDGAPVTYLPGDALGVVPQNDPALVDRIVAAIGATGDEPVPGRDGAPISLRQALMEVYSVSAPSRRLFELFVARGASDLAPLLEKTATDALKRYLTGWNEAHDVLDLLEAYPAIAVSPVELVGSFRKMLPRLYSVASSLKAHPDRVQLLVVSVRFTIRGRVRTGVCSTWLADRWPIGGGAPMYMQDQQRHFAMPASGDTPMIMIGPGTGLAPFRAFIEERRVLGQRGPNWLFFGEQHRATEFFYAEELLQYERDGLLRLDLAFSRDQSEKVYVQHRMRERARDVWRWLEDGAELFVCGDKERMAADVDLELHRIVETEGGRTAEAAREYVEALRHSGRYKRDVY